MSLFTNFIQDKTITATTDTSNLATEYANFIISAEEPSFTVWGEYEEWDSKILSKAIEAALEAHGTENATSTTFKHEFGNQLADLLSDDLFICQDDARRDYIAGNVPMDEGTAISYLSDVVPNFDETLFKDALFDTIYDHCIETDSSSILDSIGNHDLIEMSFSTAMDSTVEYDSYCCSVETVFLTDDNLEIDPSIKALFELINVSPLQFSEHLHDNGYAEDIVEKYRAIDSQVSIDTAREASLTCKDIVDVLDNATYGGTAVVFGFINVREFAENYESGKTVTVSGNPQIGIVDWNNGSGYLAGGKEAKVALTPQNISVETSHHYEVDSIFGFSVRSTIINLK